MAEAEEVLNEILAKVAKEQGYEDSEISSKQISSGGANYTSFLYLATIAAPNKEDLKLFVKVAAVGEKMRSVAPFRIFEIENFGYNHLLKTYKDLEEKHNIPKEHRLATPKFYGSSDEYLREAIVLEDLTASGYTTYDRFKSIDWEYASKGVRNMAKLHALSIAWSIEDPEGFSKTSSLKMSFDDMKGMIDFMNTVIGNAIEVTKEENKERLSAYIKQHTNMEDRSEGMMKYYSPRRRPVIAHGDYRPSNLMHKVHEDGTVDIIAVDYQTLQQSNPILDLMYFIFTGTDKAFRDQYYQRTLECYYEELCAALRRFSLDPEAVYPREDFEFELKEIQPVGLMTGMFCLLIVTVDAQDAPQVGKDMGLDDFAISPSTLYKTRLNEIVDDFIQMGVI